MYSAYFARASEPPFKIYIVFTAFRVKNIVLSQSITFHNPYNPILINCVRVCLLFFSLKRLRGFRRNDVVIILFFFW